MKPEKIFRLFFLAAVILICTISVSAQTTEFTYQGKLTDAGGSSSSYDFKFRLYDVETGGTPIAVITRNGVPVFNGVFTVQLDFGAQFDGTSRYLEIAVKRTDSNSFTTLSPRQAFTSTPYAVRALSSTTADTATNAQQLGGISANQFIQGTDPRLTDERTPTAGSGNYIQNGTTQQSATNFNISGNGTVGQTLSANVINTTTQYNIGGNRVLSIPGTTNTFAGMNSGTLSTGLINSFFGFGAGQSNTTGESNSFFGADSGLSNTTGGSNAGVGRGAGYTNTTGSFNVFIGRDSGENNLTGSNNIFLGYNAKPTLGNLNFATAIGAGAVVSTSNTIVLGRSADTVQIPGNLNISGSIAFGTFNANIINAATQYNLGGNRILSASSGNTFLGFDAGRDNSTGDRNAFFGSFAGTSNTTGGDNSFFGRESGNRNTTGTSNSFFGFAAGYSNVSGNNNAFFGTQAGVQNTASNNTFIGYFAGKSNTSGQLNVFLGANAGSNNITGSDNIFLGMEAGFSNNDGGNNTFLGRAAGYSNTSGARNTFVGSQAGVSFNSGSDVTLLGTFSSAANNLSNATAIGANAVVNRSDSVVLGNNTNVGIGTSSPAARLQVNNGDIYVGTIGAGVILRSPNGSCFRLIVNNAGVLAATAIICPN